MARGHHPHQTMKVYRLAAELPPTAEGRPWMIGSMRLFSVSRSLKIVAVLIFVLIIGVTYQQLSQLRGTMIAETRRQMARLDMVLAEQTGRAVDTIDFILRSAIDQTADQSANREAIRRQIQGVRQLLAIDIVDADGKVRLSTRPAGSTPLPPAALAQLARHAADPQLGLQFSEPLRQADGSWVALVTRRIDGPDQQFAGIGIAWVNLRYFEDFYQAVELTENGAIVLHRRDGLVLARYPHIESAIGLSDADLPPFRDVLVRDSAGTLEMDSPRDNSRRILAIRALRSFPLAVSVSVDEGSILLNWRRRAWVLALATFGCGSLLAVVLLQLARRSREVERLLKTSVAAQNAAATANHDLVVQMEERQRAEAALHQAQRVEAVGQLTGGVAHDFNNQLTVVLGNIDLIQSQPAAAPFTGRLTTMRAAAERGARLITLLLAFARRQPLMPRAVNLGARHQRHAAAAGKCGGLADRHHPRYRPGRPAGAGRPDPDRVGDPQSGDQCARCHAAGRRAADSGPPAAPRRRHRTGFTPGRHLCVPARGRYRHRHAAGSAQPCVRAVFYHQGAGSRLRPRFEPGLWRCPAIRRAGTDREQSGIWHRRGGSLAACICRRPDTRSDADQHEHVRPGEPAGGG